MRLLSFILLIIFSINCASVVPIPEISSPKQTLPPVMAYPDYMQNFYLENGLEVLTIHNSASPMVCLNTTIRVGSAFEDYNTSGMSHMLEHLLFNGTDTRSQEVLYEETDDLGAYSNAYTSEYFTDFILLLPSQYLLEGMDIQSDMLFHSVIPAEKLEKERGIVIEEIRKGRDRESTQVVNAFTRMTYGDTGEGFPTLGTISTIEHMSRQNIWDFYQTHYVPNNMILTVIGNFDPKTIRSQLEDIYGDEAPGSMPDSPVNTNPDRHLDQSYDLDQVVLDVEKFYGQVIFGLEINSPAGDSQSQYSKTIRRFALEMYIGFLNDKLSEDLPDYGVSASLIGDPYYSGITLNFDVEPDMDIQNVMKECVASVERNSKLIPDLVTEKNVSAWVKKRQVEEFSYLDQPHYYGMMKANVLAIQGGIGVISEQQVLPVLTTAIMQNEMTHFTLKPSRFNIIQPNVTKDETGETTDVVYEKSILPSGATLITSTGGGSEIMGMHILIKNRSHLEGDINGGVEILHSLLETGTDTYSSDELAELMGEIGATTKFIDMGFIPYDDYYNSTEYGYLRVECLDSDATEAIKLITHMMSNTVLDNDKVDEALKKAQGRLMMQKSTASQTARIEYNKMFLGEDHPSAGNVSGSMQSLDMINAGNLSDLQKKYFSPENYIITISSRLPHDTYKELFNSIWTNNSNPSGRYTYPIKTDSKINLNEIDMGKEQAHILLGYKFQIADEDIQAFSLLSRILSYRMAFDLREEQGLAYSLGISDGHEGDLGWLTAYIGTGVENIDTAIDGVKKYYNTSAISDLDADEIRKTVNAGKGKYLRRNLTRIGQAFYMGYYDYYFDDYSLAAERYSQLDEITVDRLKEVADKYLMLPENHTLLIVK